MTAGSRGLPPLLAELLTDKNGGASFLMHAAILPNTCTKMIMAFLGAHRLIRAYSKTAGRKIGATRANPSAADATVMNFKVQRVKHFYTLANAGNYHLTPVRGKTSPYQPNEVK